MNEQEYFNYLKSRSKLANFYRKNLLYPALSRQFSGTVLDVGCGIGDFLTFRPNTVGVDINPYNVEYCLKLGLEAKNIDNGRYPYSPHFFDGVILDNVLEHLSDPAPTLREINRVLKYGGVFIVGVPGRKGYTMDDDHKHFYEEPQLKQLLSNFGFNNKRFIYGPMFVKSTVLSKSLSQYCIYGVFEKITTVE